MAAQTANPEPASAHSSPVSAVCAYSKPPGTILVDWIGQHYGSAHLYKCNGWVWYGVYVDICWMIIEGDPNRYDYAPSGGSTPCW